MRKTHKYLSILLSAAMLITSVQPAIAATSTELKAEATVLEAIHWVDGDYSINSTVSTDTGIRMLYTGYYSQDIAVGEETRTAKVYIPEDAEQGSYFVTLTVPDGMNTENFLTNSGWIAEADANNFCLFVMEPSNGNGAWGTPEEEADYIQAAYTELIAGEFYLPYPTFYLVGYGTGGTALQKYAMTNAITVASAAFIDASDIDEAYLQTMSETCYANTEIAYSDVPAPVWIMGEGSSVSPVTKYWMNANEIEAEGSEFALGSTVYEQKAGTGNAFTYSGNVAEVAVLDETVDPADPALAHTLYNEFLSKTTRYGGNAGGNVVAARPDYEALGVEFKTMIVDGYTRQYLVYVPEAIRDSEEKHPVVYSLHGGNQTYKMMFDLSRWYEVADKNNFILVMPTATLNPATTGKVATASWNSYNGADRANDIHFLEALVAQINEDYNVDTTRCYLGGQSNGCMMTQRVGMYLSQPFAALGATSGPITSTPPEDADTFVVPFYLMFGEFDLWNWDIHTGLVNNTISYWTNRNGVGTVDDYDSCTVNGRYTTYTWENEEGIPLYKYTQTAGRGHSIVPEEIEMLWDWYSQWTLDPKQGRMYNGTPIETTEPLEATHWTDDDLAINAEIPMDNGIDMLYTGYFAQDITVGEETRTAKVYIPRNADQGAYFVALTVPDGMNTEEFLEQSGWIAKADKEDFCLFVMEPADGNGTWGTPDEEAEYVKAAYAALVAGKYYLPFPTFYLVGYGTGGTALQKYAMTNAITVASAAFINASDIDVSYLRTMNDTLYARTEIAYSDVSAPVWIIGKGSADSAVTRYWMNANESLPQGNEFALGSTVYEQKANTGNIFTSSGNVARVAVLDEDVDVLNPILAETLYDEFLSKTTRYGGNAGGNVVAARPDYEALGVEFKTMIVDGYTREYMVYVPETIRDSEEKHPVVYSLHGSNQTNKMMFDLSRWFEIAQKNNFILVMPTSTLNPATNGKVATPTWNNGEVEGRANDVKFLEALVAQIDKDYKVDTARRYFGGQSNGCMMTNTVGMRIPQYFAALGATSGPMASEAPADADTSIIPFYLTMGQFDFWSWDFHTAQANITVSYWTNRNGVGTVDDYDSVTVNGRYTTYTWDNEAGIPLYKFTQTARRGHSIIPEEMELLWDWYSDWTLDPEQGRMYKGTPIEAKAPEKAQQTVFTTATNVRKAYGDKAFTIKASTTGDGKLTYKSSNTKVATINSKGKVTILGTGRTTITITAAETASCKSASLNINLIVQPKKAVISKAKAEKKSLTVTVKKDKKASGYEVQVSSGINFAKGKTSTVTLKKNSAVTANFSNPKSGKVYYVRARAYKTIDGKNYYGAYSKIAIVKAK